MKKAWMIKMSVLFVTVISCVLFVSACGAEKQIDVKILDQYVETRMKATEGKTVQKVLDEAEIVLGKKDVVTPKLDAVIDADNAKIQISRHAEVHVSDDGKNMKVAMTGATVSEALDQTGIKLGKHDYMNHSPEAYLVDGMDISIIRRVAVTLKADGEKKKVITPAKTVGELLAEQGIRVGKKDRVSPKPSKKIKEGSKVIVKRVTSKEKTETQSIAYSVETKKSSDMYTGTSKVTRAGKNGKKKVTYRVTYVDGKEESRKVIKEEVLVKPVAQIVTQGTKSRPQPNKGSGGNAIVSKQKVYDCDGSGHGYYIIKYANGKIKYQDF